MYCPTFPQLIFQICYHPFMRYHVCPGTIEMRGPNGAASFFCDPGSNNPFVGFPRLPLASIRRFRLDIYGWELFRLSPDPVVFQHMSSFPALETFTVERETDLSLLHSALLLNPSVSPTLKILAFVDCVLTEEFMKELAQFAFDRKNTTSAWLDRVVIIHRGGILPDIASVRGLEEHVPVADVRTGAELPAEL